MWLAAAQSLDEGSSSSPVGYVWVWECCVSVHTCAFLGGFSPGIDSAFHCICCTDLDYSNFISKCDTFKNHIFM